jgi:nucleoid-associated protein YgaU
MRSGFFLAATLLLTTLAACQQTKEQPAAYDAESYEPLAALDTTPPASLEPAPASDPYARDLIVPRSRTETTREKPATETTTGTPPTTSTPPATTEDAGGVRTHIVQKNDTLYKLARKYYSDQSRWRDIWYANQTRVPDPDKLFVGTKLIIP